MKPDYKNWMPRGMVLSFLCAALALCAAAIACRAIFGAGNIPGIVLTVLAVVMLCVTLWSFMLYRAFDYNGKRQMSKQIIEGIAAYVTLPQNSVCLDVGCGSGALAIAVAKRNKTSKIVGIDRWGKEYASFSKTLCEQNAKAEGIKNASFQQGDALHLPFADASFDAVVSNYVYHNIPSGDRQEILMETLRVLKKGGRFALHDIFSKAKYGDMQAFVRRLRALGYQQVDLIDTTNGKWISQAEATFMGLSGSALLVGIK